MFSLLSIFLFPTIYNLRIYCLIIILVVVVDKYCFSSICYYVMNKATKHAKIISIYILFIICIYICMCMYISSFFLSLIVSLSHPKLM